MGKVSYIEDFESWQRDFEFFIHVNVRFSETDMFGHVNNVSPFIYFEEARIGFFHSIGLFGDMDMKQDRVPVVADLQCDYHRQMYFGDRLKLYVKADEIGKTSVDIHYMCLNQNQELCVTGRGRIVQINPKTGKPVPFTDEQKEKLKQAKSGVQ
ncbi:MAG: acyl-CoA thioesterase [Bacillaceae bacterium]|nr:acyl-CoA thioesterase [Bacillaceae bacterium]